MDVVTYRLVPHRFVTTHETNARPRDPGYRMLDTVKAAERHATGGYLSVVHDARCCLVSCAVCANQVLEGQL